MQNRNQQPLTVQRHAFTLNKNDYVGNGLYRRKFKTPITFDTNAKISIESFQMYNSFYNITSEFGNNKIIYKWIDGTSYTFTIPDGFYDVSALNYFVQQQCLANDLYILSADKTNTLFFHEFISDTTLYKHKINTTYFPNQTLFNSLGYHFPTDSTASWITWLQTSTRWSVNRNIQIDIGGLYSYFGMTSSDTLFPRTSDYSTAKNYYYESTTTPELLKINSLSLMCNLIDSKYNIESQFLSSVRINAIFGDMISLTNQGQNKYTIKQGNATELSIRILDESYQQFTIVDTNMTITLIIETLE